MWLRLCWCDSDTPMNIALSIVLSTVSRTRKDVLTAVEAETCARPNLGTSMVAGAILALLQVVQITRKWRELRAVSSYLFLVGWRSAFGAQSNARKPTSSLDDTGSNIITIALESAQRQISKPLESVVRKWSNRQTKRRAQARPALRLHHGNFPQKLVKRRA